MYAGHAVFVAVPSSWGNAPRSASFLLTTFYVCGRFPIDWGNSPQTVGTVWVSKSQYSAGETAVTAHHANWTRGLVRTTNSGNGAHGCAFGANEGTIASLSFSYVTCLKNEGQTTFYHASGADQAQNWPQLTFEYVNFVESGRYGAEWSTAVLSVINGKVSMSHCIFKDNTYDSLFSLPAQETTLTECVWSGSGSPSGATTLGMTRSSTATYDPGVPVSVCILPPGTTFFTRSNPFRPTSPVSLSAGWNATGEIGPSVGPLGSRAIPASHSLPQSEQVELSSSFGRSGALGPSANPKPSAEWKASAGRGETEEFGETAAYAESGGFNETREPESTKGYSGSPGFSASVPFSQRNSPYHRRRFLTDLSGYAFFIFFYGDAA
jgi:hypothetical protein